ncbi:hypothetical protein CPB97_001048 [Podila verticillata]|nr:hypothetical protein CPB97_001048 [Podila verticillata]
MSMHYILNYDRSDTPHDRPANGDSNRSYANGRHSSNSGLSFTSRTVQGHPSVNPQSRIVLFRITLTLTIGVIMGNALCLHHIVNTKAILVPIPKSTNSTPSIPTNSTIQIISTPKIKATSSGIAPMIKATSSGIAPMITGTSSDGPMIAPFFHLLCNSRRTPANTNAGTGTGTLTTRSQPKGIPGPSGSQGRRLNLNEHDYGMSLESRIHPLEHLPHHDVNSFSQAGPYSGTDMAMVDDETEANKTHDHIASDDFKNNDMGKCQAVEGTSRTRKLAFIQETGCRAVLAEGKKKRGRPFGSKNIKFLTHLPEIDTKMEIGNETHPGPIPSDALKNNDKDKRKAIGGASKRQKLTNIKESDLADPAEKKPRGRPLGSKNKPKPYPELSKSKSKKASKNPSNKRRRACESDAEGEIDQLVDDINEPCVEDYSSDPSDSPSGSHSSPGGSGGPLGSPDADNNAPLDGDHDNVSSNSGGTDEPPPGPPSSGSPSGLHQSAPSLQSLVKVGRCNVQQFQRFCNMFETVFGDLSLPSSEPFSLFLNDTNSYVIEIVDSPNFVLQISFFFHWKRNHIETFNTMLQKVTTLHRLDLKLGTEDEINTHLPKYLSPAERRALEVKRTTCCPSGLMNLIHKNPHLGEIRLRGVKAFFNHNIVCIPDMHHLRVLEMDVAAWVPETRRRLIVRPLKAQEAVIEEMYIARFKKFLQGLQGLERLVLHCPERRGAFARHLTELKETMSVFAEARTRQQEQQRSRFTIRFQAPNTNSTFEIEGLDPQGRMTDVHAVFSHDDGAETAPSMSVFAGLFDDHALFGHVTRLIATNALPVWCMQALGFLNVEIAA